MGFVQALSATGLAPDMRLPAPVRRLARRARGLPARARPFEGATLGGAEGRIAREALAAPASWRDPEPVRRFEEAFAHWSGASSATSFMGARNALVATLRALGIGKGVDVLVPAYTCVVVPNAVAAAGARPVYADIELDTYGLDVDAVRAVATPRTKAVLLHHLYGLVARDYAAVADLARDRGWAVVEDCAQASGARWNGRPVGALGDVAIHSTEKTKVLTTVFGGLATTSDDRLAARLRAIQAEQAWPHDGDVRRLLGTVGLLLDQAGGGAPARRHPDNWVSTVPAELDGRPSPMLGTRMSAPQALLGLSQLRSIDRLNTERRRRARRWDRWAAAEGYGRPRVVAGSVPVFLRYPVLAAPKDKADLSWGAALGVKPGVWFVGQRHPVPGTLPGAPNGAEAVRRCVNLPTLW